MTEQDHDDDRMPEHDHIPGEDYEYDPPLGEDTLDDDDDEEGGQ